MPIRPCGAKYHAVPIMYVECHNKAKNRPLPSKKACMNKECGPNTSIAILYFMPNLKCPSQLTRTITENRPIHIEIREGYAIKIVSL